MANLIVTLLSDQTIPNVQFIKYIRENKCKDKQTEYLFVSTDAMEKKGVGDWIRKVCEITNFEEPICVNHSDISDIENKLSKLTFDKYEQIFVNITGGTKMMSLAVSDFFKTKPNARIYYIDGEKCFLNFPVKDRISDDLADNISLKEYLESYGFEIRGNGLPSSIPADYTKQFIHSFMQFKDEDSAVIETLRKDFRGKTCKTEIIEGLNCFLERIKLDYCDNKLTKEQVKYLTGEWFEDFVHYKIKEENGLSEDNIKTGIHIIKDNVDNELDVVYLQTGKLSVIECKTLLDSKLLQDTIYKSTALSKNLGLFAKFYIYTLSDRETVMKQLERAKLFGIEIKCKEDLVDF